MRRRGTHRGSNFLHAKSSEQLTHTHRALEACKTLNKNNLEKAQRLSQIDRHYTTAKSQGGQRNRQQDHPTTVAFIPKIQTLAIGTRKNKALSSLYPSQQSPNLESQPNLLVASLLHREEHARRPNGTKAPAANQISPKQTLPKRRRSRIRNENHEWWNVAIDVVLPSYSHNDWLPQITSSSSIPPSPFPAAQK
eukprot:c19855_g1_i1 orf=566-1147(+)